MAKEPVSFENAAEWHAWLKANHAKSEAVLLRLEKKRRDKKTLTYAEAVEAALVWGWFDGQSAGDRTLIARGERWLAVRTHRARVLPISDRE